MTDKQDKNGSFLGGALIGGLIGAVSYFLFGTEKGKKTQKKIAKESEKAYQKAKPTIEKIGEEAKELIEKGKAEVKKLDKKEKVSKPKAKTQPKTKK